MRDVEWVKHKGKFNFKALTPKAREAMGSDMGGPWKMASDVFFYGVLPDRFDAVLHKLKMMGLQTDAEEIDIKALTEF